MVELTERVAPTFRSSFAEPSIELRLDEAVALATAWAASLGDAAGIRVLILKGDALAQMGLRQPRVSADVDVLIEPSRFDDYCALLTSAGWTERELPFISSRVSPHSITYVSHGWPCDIDVHSYFPGFLNDPQQVFHELWGRSQQLSFARFKVRVPDRISSILIAALHSLRDGAVSTRSASDLSELLSTDLTDAERTELSDIARRTGCDGSLEAFLSELGLDVSPTPSRALSEWRSRVASASRGAYPWIMLWRSSRWRDRPMIAVRAIWPTDTDILLAHPTVPRRFWPILEARARRLGRGVRGLPLSVRALRNRT
ncbi:hypothetical protein BH10ACT5_BH10ACT5_21570 [soil metagenome]